MGAEGGGAPVELRPGIHQLGGPKGGGCKTYLVRGTKKNLLVDAGLPSDAGLIAAQLESLGLSRGDVHLVVLTHEHVDHIGGVPFFPAGTVVAAHDRAANKISLQDEFVLMSKAFGHRVEDFHIDIRLHHGTVIDVGGFVLHTLHTPGHCSGAICLYEPDQRLLFTGDTIFAGGTLGGIFPSGNISDYIGTLQQLDSLRIAEMYPGHGRISTAPHEDLARAIEASKTLMAETRALFDSLQARSEFGAIMKSIAAYSRSAPAGEPGH
jgi:glyoxylase-like metal-dependent hydrolase (beta-lactamase superfamily II)